jgi:hypothetical protein
VSRRQATRVAAKLSAPASISSATGGSGASPAGVSKNAGFAIDQAGAGYLPKIIDSVRTAEEGPAGCLDVRQRTQILQDRTQSRSRKIPAIRGWQGGNGSIYWIGSTSKRLPII